MSRIGNRTLEIPTNITVEINKNFVTLKSGNNSLIVNYPFDLISIEQNENKLTVKKTIENKQANMYQGTVNANLSNALIGLSKGFSKSLELKGVGYKAKLEGNKINLSLGFSHPVIIDIPTGIKVEIPSATEINIFGIDKVKVGQFAADIRKYRKPEPYKGKGVLYKGEQIVRKVGKTADKKK